MDLSDASEKISTVTRPGIDHGTLRLVAQCLNHYATPGLNKIITYRKIMDQSTVTCGNYIYEWELFRLFLVFFFGKDLSWIFLLGSYLFVFENGKPRFYTGNLQSQFLRCSERCGWKWRTLCRADS